MSKTIDASQIASRFAALADVFKQIETEESDRIPNDSAAIKLRRLLKQFQQLTQRVRSSTSDAELMDALLVAMSYMNFAHNENDFSRWSRIWNDRGDTLLIDATLDTSAWLDVHGK